MSALSLESNGLAVLGGVHCTPEVVRRKLDASIERGKGNVVSVQVECSTVGEDRDATLLRAAVGLPHNQVRVASISSLYAAGFTLKLYLTEETNPNHHHVEFGADDSPDAIERFVSCFGEPEPNPTRRRDS